MNNGYNDIIDMNRPLSYKRARMPMHDRAAQFAPFAALTGFDSKISEASRLADEEPETVEFDIEC